MCSDRAQNVKRIIFHVDVNSAFLSWEAARRVALGEKDIRLAPSAVGGDRDKRTGVILAKSIPAKKYGISTGEPVAMALRKCPSLILAKPDFHLYEQNSRAFMDICREYAPVVEKFSIDECYLDMTGTGRMYPDPVATAHEISRRIKSELGFTVNIGVGSNKLLAKMASDFEKPDKVHTLFDYEVEKKMWPLPVGDLFLVGRSTAAKLEKLYIKTIGDLARMDERRLIRMFGEKFGTQLNLFAHGIDESEVCDERGEAKSYSISTTLEEDVKNYDTAYSVFHVLTDSVSSRMRADDVRAYCVSVNIRDNDFITRSKQRMLNEPTDLTSEIYDRVVELFRELWDGKTPLRLLGVCLSHVTHDEFSQVSLFDTPESTENKKRLKRMDKALDSIGRRFGTGTVARASSIEAAGKVGAKYNAQIDLKNNK